MSAKSQQTVTLNRLCFCKKLIKYFSSITKVLTLQLLVLKSLSCRSHASSQLCTVQEVIYRTSCLLGIAAERVTSELQLAGWRMGKRHLQESAAACGEKSQPGRVWNPESKPVRAAKPGRQEWDKTLRSCEASVLCWTLTITKLWKKWSNSFGAWFYRPWPVAQLISLSLVYMGKLTSSYCGISYFAIDSCVDTYGIKWLWKHTNYSAIKWLLFWNGVSKYRAILRQLLRNN